MNGEETVSTRTVERALALLAVVCEEGKVSLSEAARITGLAVSTALRLLRTLEAAGFAAKADDGNYVPGSRVIQLGALALTDQYLVRLAAEPMARLAASTGESAYLSLRGPDQTALYVAITEGTHSVRHVSWVGRTIPLEGTAAGAAFAGKVPPRGYIMVESAVEPDVTAIAAPIGPPGQAVAVLSLLVPSYRAEPAKTAAYGQAVAAAALALSGELTGPVSRFGCV